MLLSTFLTHLSLPSCLTPRVFYPPSHPDFSSSKSNLLFSESVLSLTAECADLFAFAKSTLPRYTNPRTIGPSDAARYKHSALDPPQKVTPIDPTNSNLEASTLPPRFYSSFLCNSRRRRTIASLRLLSILTGHSQFVTAFI